MVLLLDNRDSFVHNLARYVRELGREAEVRRSDEISLDDIAELAPSHIVVSPGPSTPAEAGISTAAILRFGAVIPVLGVCLGHQCIGIAYGARVVRATRPVHGRTSPIVHTGTDLFAGLPSPLRATRYHSLVVSAHPWPDQLRILAHAEDDGEIMAIAHVRHPVVGVQFHPESAASEWGYSLIDRFLNGTARPNLPAGADGLAAS